MKPKAVNPWGGKMPKTFQPRLLMSMDPSSDPSHLGLCTTLQTIIFSLLWYLVLINIPIRQNNIKFNKR